MFKLAKTQTRLKKFTLNEIQNLPIKLINNLAEELQKTFSIDNELVDAAQNEVNNQLTLFKQHFIFLNN
jgi:hypothetical protein